MEEGGAAEELMTGGIENAGAVVRIGDTIRRPRRSGSEVVEALLLHLERAGFESAPRFLGIDDEGRQVLQFIDGVADERPPWHRDDDENARQLGIVAAKLSQLHRATASFEPPPSTEPRRPLPIHGTTWSHADVSYTNLVYRGDDFAGLIDWEFAAPGHHLYDPASLIAMSTRAPKLGAADNDRRTSAVARAIELVAEGYGMDDAERSELPTIAATLIDDAIGYWSPTQPADVLDAWRWRTRWFRENADLLTNRG